MKTIVVVTQDDHTSRALCEVVRTVLSEVHGGPVQVLPACSVDDVLDILANGRIDVLITEHQLTNITGLGLIRWLDRALTRTTKILLTSDSRILAEPWEFAGPEINAVLPRPVGRESLKLALQRWLEPPSTSGRFGQGRDDAAVSGY